MSGPRAIFRLPDGRACALGVGEIIGRMASASLQIDDPRVSEAHAMLSVRGGELWLLALRRRVALGEQSLSELRLEPGQRVALAQGLALEVLSVELPEEALAVEAPGLPPTTLSGVCALRGRPRPSLSNRYEPDAPCLIWDTGEGFRLQVGAVVRPLQPGDSWEVDGVRFLASLLPLRGLSPTRMTGGIDPPLRVVTSWDTASVQPEGAPPVALSGVSARILSELASVGAPIAWEAAAHQIWPDEDDLWLLRKRWDIALARLRSRLREGGVRADLVRPAGTGLVELFLRRGDVLEDRA